MARHPLRKQRAASRASARHRENPAYRLLSEAKHRAKKSGVPFALILTDIVVPKACPVLGITLRVGGGDSSPTLDRVIPELGYTPGNVVVISMRANRIKNNATVAELLLIVSYIESTVRKPK